MVIPDALRRVTMDEFIDFVHRPENNENTYELINGEIIDVSPGRTINSEYPHLIAFSVRLFCLDHRLPCHTSGGDGAYNIQGNIVAPDFAYKPTPMSDEYPDPDPPLWVVEIISPTDKADEIRKKRRIYLQAGILYWEMYPLSRSVDVYASGKLIRTVDIDGILDGGDVLPGFTLALKDLFQNA